ncbi:RRQRL motif-containing zinc-binding protein [Streptomyces sp. NPDC059744]|uniref:RRQRL motif-containing zinc-binding protein n=1 Tax=Streptomyces sp. NPDC059744 TaxID=3346929 RepID=UPI00365A540C
MVSIYDWQASPEGLATRRQLRALGLRAGGHDPVAQLRCRHCLAHPARTCTRMAYLYRIDLAKPVRPMTLAKEAALDRAMARLSTCPRCRRRYDYCLPRKTIGSCLLRTTGASHGQVTGRSVLRRRGRYETGELL